MSRGAKDDYLADGDLLPYVYAGKVIKRERDPDTDPETQTLSMRGLAKIEIPGIFDEGVWARPKGSGSYRRGRMESPPIGCDVYVQFINGDPEMGIWEYADPSDDEVYPEYEHPDVAVDGDVSFRFVRDRRDGQQYAAWQIIKELNNIETVIAEIRFDIENNAIRLHADSTVSISSMGLVDISCNGDIQIAGRKISPVDRPL